MAKAMGLIFFAVRRRFSLRDAFVIQVMLEAFYKFKITGE